MGTLVNLDAVGRGELNDKNDGTGYQFGPTSDGGTLVFRMSSFSLPANSRITRITLDVRRRCNDGWSGLTATVYNAANGQTFGPRVDWAALYNYAVAGGGSTLPYPNFVDGRSATTTHDFDGQDQFMLDNLTVRLELSRRDVRYQINQTIAEVDVTVEYNTAPTTTSVTTSPSGTLTTTSRVSLMAQATDPDGDTIEIVQFKVFDLATINAASFNPETSKAYYESGAQSLRDIQTGALRTTPLVNLTTYRAYARTQDINGSGRWGPWAAGENFTVALEPVAAPSLQLTDDEANGRVKIDIDGRDNQLSTEQASAETAGQTAIEWGGTNVTILRYAANASSTTAPVNIPNGSQVLGMRAQAGGTLTVDTSSTQYGRIYPNRRYTFVALVQSATIERQMQAEIVWQRTDGFNSSIKPTSTSVNVTSRVLGSRWTLIAVSDISPADASKAFVRIRVLGAAANEIHYWDAASFVPGFVNTTTLSMSTMETGFSTAGYSQLSSQGAISVSTAEARQGAQSIVMTSNNPSTNYSMIFAMSQDGTDESAMPLVMPDTPMTIFLSTLAEKAAHNVSLGVTWYDKNRSFMSSNSGIATGQQVVGEWVNLRAVVTPPANAGSCRVFLNIPGVNGPGERHYFDTVGTVIGDAPGWVAGPAFTRGGVVAAQRFQMERSTDGGVTWEDFNARVINNAGDFVALDSTAINDYGITSQQGDGTNNGSSGYYRQEVTLYDYEAPRGKRVAYRVKALSNPDANYSGQSQWSEAQFVVPGRSICTWVKDPNNPKNSIEVVHAQTGMTIDRTRPQGQHYAFGREDPIVVFGDQRMGTFSVTLWFHNDAKYQDWLKLERLPQKLLLQTGFGDQAAEQFYFTIDPNVATDLVTADDMSRHQMRFVRFIARETTRPELVA